MSFSWRDFNIKRFYGLDLNTNIVEVMDGKSLGLDNIYVQADGSPGKRPGDEIMFDKDESGLFATDEVGTCTINGTKYYFKFAGGSFQWATTLTGTPSFILPSPAISTTNQVWWAVLDDKLFFVDGVNDLRYFDGTAIKTSSIYERPRTAPTTASIGTGFDYTYTIDNGLGESPAIAYSLVDKVSAATIAIAGNTNPHTLVVGDKIRIYSKATTIAAASKNVTYQSGSFTGGTYGVDESGGYAEITSVQASYNIGTIPLSDTFPQLYTELGLAINKTAPTALTGITVHYSRLVGWKDSYVYNSKVTNPHAWPDDSAAREAFVYSYGAGDGEVITRCITFLECLYVLKPSNIAIFGGIGPDDTGNNAYTFRRLETNGIGCIAGKSVCTMGEEGTLMLLYLSANGFMGTNGSIPIRIGMEIEPEIQEYTQPVLLKSYAIYDSRLGFYYCAVGPDNQRIIYVLDIRPNLVAGQTVLTGWFRWSKNNVKCMFYDTDRALFGTFNGLTMSQRVAGISSDYSDVKQEYLQPSAIDTGTGIITVTQSYTTGDLVKMRTNDAMPGGLTANVPYFAIRVSATTIKLASTYANAVAGTSITISTQGAGVHSLIGSKAINAYYDTNWIAFQKPLMVKKIGKVGLVFNAIASSVSVNIETAFDWVPTFGDSKTIQGGANHAWGTEAWGTGFVWGGGAVAAPINYALPKRKVRSIRFKFSNNILDQDFNLQSLNIPFAYIRNRGNFG